MTSQVVGVLGGTFDPVHRGHLHAAAEVQRVFDLRRVLFVPCALPPHKDAVTITAVGHRLAMLELALAGRTGLEVCTIEIDRGGPSYTIDTLRALRAQGALAPLFILGMDALVDLPTWRLHDRLVAEFDLVAVDRPGDSLARARRVLDEETVRRIVEVEATGGGGRSAPPPPPGTGGRIFHLTLPPVAVSSRRIRARAAAGLSLAGLVPPEVARYIQDQELYPREEAR